MCFFFPRIVSITSNRNLPDYSDEKQSCLGTEKEDVFGVVAHCDDAKKHTQ